MKEPAKRNAFFDWLFGAPLAGDELARHRAVPRWVRRAKSTLYLLILILLAAGLLGVIDALPIIGAWLARERSIVMIACLAIVVGLDWYFERPAERRHAR